MPEISIEKIKAYRAQTYHSLSALNIKSAGEAVEFVNERGFVFFWPIKGIELPSLWTAAAGDRPVPTSHDDPAHITWNWKDSLLGRGHWYYGRLLYRRNTIVSLECLPFFYALSPNFGDPENDYLEQYQQGALTLEAKLVYEALLKKGALDTISLRREVHLISPESTMRFNRALETLQMELKILPIGISRAGVWKYAYIFDLLPRHFPHLQHQSRSISEAQAQKHLVHTYLQSLGAASLRQIGKLFPWGSYTLQKTLQSLQAEGALRTGLQMEGEKEAYAAIRTLI
ncbi:MAG: winged helix DNA-binding domain-containing protein [Anaerolineaceae bacterium]|nr:winged helix DNA-binding domain-containing protein [Anaerolineaceae bacterium]